MKLLWVIAFLVTICATAEAEVIKTVAKLHISVPEELHSRQEIKYKIQHLLNSCEFTNN